MTDDHEQGFGTRAIHAGQCPDPTTGAIMTPVYLTSTYVQEAPAVLKGYDYSRTCNPTRTALENNIAALERGAFGLCFSSGMGALNTVVNLLRAGDHVVAGNDLYGGTYRMFVTLYEKLGLRFSFVDLADTQQLADALRPETKLVFLESPSNPLLKLCDIRAIATLCRERDVLTVCDNTFATPYLQTPLDLGMDIVAHSTTKYMGGHSDVVGGALVVNDGELHRKLAHFQNTVGATPGPLDCFLVLRGTKTLHLRMERHCATAMEIARALEVHPRVERVHYPWLESHPQQALAKRQMRASEAHICGTRSLAPRAVKSAKPCSAKASPSSAAPVRAVTSPRRTRDDASQLGKPWVSENAMARLAVSRAGATSPRSTSTTAA